MNFLRSLFFSTLLILSFCAWVFIGASSTPFDPSQVSGLKMWVKADALVKSDGNTVTTWSDSSSNGYGMTGAGATPPIYKASIINGKPIVRFDGVSTTWLQGTGSAYGNLYANNAWSYWVVLQTATVTGTNTTASSCYANDLILGGFFVYQGMTMLSNGGTLTVGVCNFPGSYTAATKSAFTLNTPFIAHSRHDSGNIVVAINNGVEGSSASGNTTSNSDAFLLGGGATAGVGHAKMDLAEVLVYNVVVGSSDRTSIWNYLNAKYAVY